MDGNGELHSEGRANTFFALARYFPTVRLYDGTCDQEAEPDARMDASVAALERKKRWNMRSCSSAGMPTPVSRTSMTPPFAAAGADVDAAARGRELDRVGDQVVEHLREAIAVAVQGGHRSVCAISSTPSCSARGRAASTASRTTASRSTSVAPG